MNMDNSKRPLLAHACILSANICWGLMSPIGKDAMLNGVDNLNLVFMRALGGALFFWIVSLFVKREHVPLKDIFAFCGDGLLGLIGNQCCFTIGLSITSPSPYFLKRRILSDNGHLSNEDCAKLALHLAKSGAWDIIVGHLSRENNTPQLAYDTVSAGLAGENVGLHVAPMDKMLAVSVGDSVQCLI